MTPKNKTQHPLPTLAASMMGLLVSSPSWAETASKASPEVTLPTVEVQASNPAAAERRSYRRAVTTVGKTPTLDRDVPQSTTTVTESLMQDQGATSLHQALRNVSGLTFNAGEGGRSGDVVTLRGFALSTDLYLDGVRDVGQYNRDVFNIERLEVLRGPASMVFGRGATGGVINQVSKQPQLASARELSLMVGDHGQVRGSVDLNQAVGEHAALRLNAMATKLGSVRDEVYSKRQGLAPSLRWGINTPTEVTLSYFGMREHNLPDYGVPYYQGKPLDVPQNRFYGLAAHDYEKTETHIGTLNTQHRLSADWNLHHVLRLGYYQRELWPSAPRLNLASGSLLSDNTEVRRSRPGRSGTDRSWSSQLDVSGQVHTGALKHELLLGLDLGQERSSTLRWTSTQNPPSTTVGDPQAYPDMADPVAKPSTQARFRAQTVGVYAQDMLSLNPQWKVLLGLRGDRFAGQYRSATFDGKPEQNTERTDRVASYRLGLIYQPDAAQSYYLSTGNSFNPSGETYALDPRGSNTPPEKNRNLELGAKWDLFDGDLALRTALFRTIKTNERNTDPLVTDVYLLSGRRHTDGLELELSGHLSPDWEIFAGWSLMRSKIDRHIDPTQEGREAPNTPRHTTSLWSSYRLNPAWKIGGGFEAVGRRYTSNSNTTVLPGYLRWNAMAGWEQGAYAVQLNLTNLFNQKHFENLYGGHAVYGPARSVQLTGTVKF